jgi:hypothetical protein
VDLAIGIALGSGVQVAVFLLPVIVLVDWMMGVTNMTLVLDDLQCYSLLVFQLVLFPTLLTADIRKLENDLRVDNKLRIINRFSDIPVLFLYSIIAVIAFFFT